jgi:Putative zinc-finger
VHLNLVALTCHELVAMLGEYRDQTLDSAKRVNAEAHLLTCAECMLYLQSYEQTIRLSKRTFRDALDSELRDLPEATIREILQLGARL